MITLPPVLANLRQFCCRVEKRPYVRDPTGKLTPRWKDPSGWLTFEEATTYWKNQITVSFKIDDDCYEDRFIEGVGFLNTKSEDPTKQIVGGDLDACRDPETGILGAWATKFLEDTKPFYTEVSPSKCGMRFFYLAHLPNRVDSLFANGPQDELSEETKKHIQSVKEVRSGWNGLELYEANRHLTITGTNQEISEVVDRSGLLMAALSYLEVRKGKNDVPKQANLPLWAAEMEKDSVANRFPKLTMSDVINISEFHYEGEQLAGSHPMLGSQSGHNVLITSDGMQYCYMHNGINAGGDAWVWLAHECGAAPWEVSGNGLLRDPVIRAKTLEYAARKGYIKPEQIPVRTVPVEHLLKLEDVAIDKGDDDEPKWVFSPTTATTSILKTMKLAMSKESDMIYWFDGRIFNPDGERIIGNALRAAGGDLANIKNCKETVVRLQGILLNHPVEFDHNPFLLGVQNGVVDLSTGIKRDYLPEDLITDAIKVVFDPSAKCPGFIRFLSEVAPSPDDRLMLVDWFAIHAIRLMFPYVMFLNGLGRNGKGLYEKLLRSFYGESAFCQISLEEISVKYNRFAGADLKGKRGQIISEAGDESNKGKKTLPTSFLKNATGDGMIDSDRKNKSRIKFKPFYKATIDSNDMPRIEDTSKGWIERFCKADLPYQYLENLDANNPMVRLKDPHLEDKLTTVEEFSGILNLIITRTPEIIKTMTITKRPGEEMFSEYETQSNSVTTFLERFCDYTPGIGYGKDVFVDDVFQKYQTWCDINVCDKVDDRRFGAAVKKYCDGAKSERIRDKDQRHRIYHGFTMDMNRYQESISLDKSISVPSVPTCPDSVPLKSIAVPSVPSNVSKWCDMEKFNGISV